MADSSQTRSFNFYLFSAVASCALQLSVYAFFRCRLSHSGDAEKRAWVITGFSAFTTSILGICALPMLNVFSFVPRLMSSLPAASLSSLFSSVAAAHREMFPSSLDDDVSRFMVVFFMCYLSLDLLVGLVDYPQYLTLLTGYIHHLAYLAAMWYSIYAGITLPTRVCFLMEIPTFFLSLHHVRDSLFWLKMCNRTFVWFRVVFNVYCLLMWILLKDWVGMLLMSGALTMHVDWMFRLNKKEKRKIERLKQ